MDCIEAQQPTRAVSLVVFPADWGDEHFIGVVRVLDRICQKAKLEAVTPHVLRHTFASVAGDLGFSGLTIAGLLGHSAHGVTQRYVHLDTALVVAADRVSMEIAKMLGCEAPTAKSGNTSREHLALPPADAAPQPVEDFSFSSLTIDFTHRQS
jgi:Phage integrase family